MSLVRMPNRGSTSITLTRARGRPCEMERLFSPESRCTIWRKLWLWLAESQKELGIVYLVPNPGTNNFREERIIEDEALEQLRRCCHVFHYQATKPVEHLLDIRAQYHFVTDLDAPRSKHWLNIGVTHEYTLENTEQILMACALDILNTKFSMLLYRLRNFAMDHRSAQCLMYKPDSETPYLTTIGERVAGWAKTLGSILWAFQILRCNIGSAGSQPITPGEQNSIAFFDKLSMTQHFEGDRSKCEKLDDLLRQKMGFERCHAKDYFGYRSDTNGHLGHLCDKLGDTALQVVEDLDHFDSTGQLVEKRATNNGSPVTAGDPLYRQSPLLRIASETLRQVAHTFKDPRVSKTSGHEEYIMARLFKHAARVVRVLQSIVEGLYYDAQNAYNIKCFMMPLMISSPLISRITPRGEDRMTVMWHLGVIGMLVMYQPFQLRTHGFLYMLRRHEFFRRHADEVRNAILSVGDVSHSQTLVYEICGENGIIDRRLQPYSGYIREMTAGEARLQAPLRIQAALGH
ncbi:hypothetical protein H9Q69_011490 [Fusarium xylarioides]|uniref:Uncharacterized protein n=1 Tax=Fusarium xylarioides TaxID=221167 RepID=A0A9P7KUP8_9HYPO|nr:hypothetical protein H9Q70_014058 [Fusarium xylarioides]KAG5757904.1 hypothetical protein H9Q72_013959 [Fusarium xylarioides]KAG5789450.1 hypothetical protein H9Q69_011490 [Fusarium xylarioides]